MAKVDAMNFINIIIERFSIDQKPFADRFQSFPPEMSVIFMNNHLH